MFVLWETVKLLRSLLDQTVALIVLPDPPQKALSEMIQYFPLPTPKTLCSQRDLINYKLLRKRTSSFTLPGMYFLFLPFI